LAISTILPMGDQHNIQALFGRHANYVVEGAGSTWSKASTALVPDLT
jgi:hypothetical protein